MPNDTNPLNNLRGGNLMHWMDMAAGVCAARHSASYVVTASVDHLSFQLPVPLGDVVTIEATITRSFNTSMEINVEVYGGSLKGGDVRLCTHAYFTFVAVDDKETKPRPVPPVLPVTRKEKNLYEGAKRRRELRLILSGRMKPSDAAEIRSLFLEGNDPN